MMPDGTMPRGELQGYSNVPIVVEGSFANPTAGLTYAGKGFVPTVDGTGEFTVTFQDSFPIAESFVAWLQTDSVDDKVVVVGPWVAANKALTLYVYDISGTALADPDFDSGDRIHFQAHFDNSGVWS